ncbi:MAG: hypothetical protein IJM30_11250 [Thermoguttaceae bacterium]|nr:hypothetical protein [Thermoguttaceae bacterium]
MTETLSRGGSEGGKAAKALEELGVAQKDVAVDPSKAFERIIKALQATASESKRTALASNLFGDSVEKLGDLLEQGRDSFESFNKEAKRYGIAISDDAAETSRAAREEIERLKQTAQNLAATFAVALLPPVENLAGSLANGIGSANAWAAQHRAVVKVIVALGEAIGSLYIAQTARAALSALTTALKTTLSSIRTNAVATYKLMAARLSLSSANRNAAKSELELDAAAKKNSARQKVLRGAILGVGAALAIAYAGVKALFDEETKEAELSDKMEKARENADAARNIDAQKFSFLENVANQTGLANDVFSKAVSCVESLSQKYGDLGVEVDEASRSISMAADAQGRFNKALAKDSLEALDKQIAEESENYQKLQDEQNRKINAYTSWRGRLVSAPRNTLHAIFGDFVRTQADVWEEQVGDVGNRILDQQQKLHELRKRRAQIEQGNKDAILGEDGLTWSALDAEAAAKQIEDLDKKIADAETKARRASQTRIQNAIEDARAEEAAYVEALKARLALEKAKPDAERDEEAVKSLNKRIEESSERISVVVDKINSEEFQKLQEQIERTEDKISGAVESEVARRVAEIDKETEAYRKLLEAAKEVADEEKKRELETKLQGLDAAAKERKDAIYDEQIAKTPTEALINLEKSLASAIKDAMADGALSGSEREKIAKAREEYEAQKRNDEFEKTTQRYDDALEKLRLAADKLATMSDDMFDNYDKEERALASEEYARAADELAEASAALADFGQNEEESRADMVDAINAATDDSTKEFISCVTTSNADASQAAMKASLGVQSRLDLGNQYADITADATNSVDRMIANSGGTFGNIERLLTGILNKGGQAQFG